MQHVRIKSKGRLNLMALFYFSEFCFRLKDFMQLHKLGSRQGFKIKDSPRCPWLYKLV